MKNNIEFLSLSFKNFMSYGKQMTTIDLSTVGSTLILGQNLDNTTDGIVSNGTGKTVIINALTFGLFDKALSSINKDNLINNRNKCDLAVIVEWRCGDVYYKVCRIRKGGKTGRDNTVEFYERKGNNKFNKRNNITPDSIGNTNNLIERKLGISFDIFCRIVVFSATHSPFLELPLRSQHAANQVDIIEGLFNLTMLSEKADYLKELIKDTERSWRIQREKIDQLEKEHARHNIQLESANKRVTTWIVQNAKKIKALQTKLDKISEIDLDKQKKLHDQLLEVSDAIRSSTTHIKQLTKSLDVNNAGIVKYSNEKSNLQDHKCPYCLQQFEDVLDKLQDAELHIVEHRGQIASDEDELVEEEQYLKQATQLRARLKKQITVQNINELIEIHNQSAMLLVQIDDLNNMDNPFIEPLKELEDYAVEAIDYTEINALDTKIEHQKLLIKLLTKKDSFVRKVLLGKNIPFLNTRLQIYLNELGLPHKVEFTHQMTAKISQLGNEMDFGNLSSGQKARVNLALSFAFRDVLQSMHGFVNLCILDEALDVGLCGVGVQLAATMLKRKASDENLSMYIISHRDEINTSFDKLLRVEYKNGFSSIVV